MVYQAALNADRKFTKANILPKPVISVGNITWGGTGKTPIVIKLAKELLNANLKLAILTRGYFKKSKAEGCLIVSDGKSILTNPSDCGDEPFLLAEKLPGVIVAVGKDRVLSADTVMKKYFSDIFILDDGFQHWKIKRNLDIVCVNALNPFGNGCTIPAGILREPVSAVKRAGIVIITNAGIADKQTLDYIQNKLALYYKGQLIKAQYKAEGISRIIDGKNFVLQDLAAKNAVVFSGLGENGGFIKLLEYSGFIVSEKVFFRDHHWYTLDEIKSILSLSLKNQPIITTQKDAVKIKQLLISLPREEAERFYSLDVEMEWLEGNDIWQSQLKRVLQYS